MPTRRPNAPPGRALRPDLASLVEETRKSRLHVARSFFYRIYGTRLGGHTTYGAGQCDARVRLEGTAGDGGDAPPAVRLEESANVGRCRRNPQSHTQPA